MNCTEKKRVLVTGATSSLGRVLVPKMIDLGFDITLVSSQRLKFFYPDINSLSYEDMRYKKEGDMSFDFIIHLATKYEDTLTKDLVACNLRLPKLLLKRFVLDKEAVFVNVDSFYSGMTNYPMRHKFYVKSKEKLFNYLNKMLISGSVRYLNLVIHHMFGPFDSEKKLIHELISSARLGRDIVLENPYKMINFVYVKDVAKNIISLLLNIDKFINKSVEIKSSREISVHMAANAILEIFHSKSKILDVSGQAVIAKGQEEKLFDNCCFFNEYTFEAGILDIRDRNINCR